MPRHKKTPPVPEQQLDQLAIRIRDKLYKAFNKRVERFIDRMDEIIEDDAPAIQAPKAQRTLPASQVMPATPREARSGRKCRNCRQPGHRADKCPNAAKSDDDSPSEQPQPRKQGRKLLGDDEVRRLIGLVQTDNNQRAMETLLRWNSGLVHRIARKARWHSMAYEDIVQEGLMGLMKAIRNFDLSKPFKLSTYSAWWIWHYIVRSHENNAEIRLPARYGLMLSKMSKAQLVLEGQLKRAPTPEEIAAKAKLEVADVKRLLNRGHVSMSLDAIKLDDGVESTLHEILASNVASPDDERIQADLRSQIDEALSHLPPREAEVIKLRYLDGEDRTLRDVGDMLPPESNTGATGVSRERVRQLEGKALRRLSRIVRSMEK